MKKSMICFFLVFPLLVIYCTSNQRNKGIDNVSIPAEVKYAGVRSSSYGIKPFPRPDEWVTAVRTMSGFFAKSTPCAIWIVGILQKPKACRLEFPGDGQEFENIVFIEYDKHKPYLDHFDKKGIKVFLQVEPASADVETLMDLVLNRYKHHKCVVGLGIDVEWYREAENPQWGIKVDDDTAEKWEKKVKSFNPGYRLFLKHWDRNWMPPKYRGDIIFISDSQELESMEKMVDEFVNYWADFFKPNPVYYQIGYRSDRTWWEKLNNPPKDLGEAIAKKLDQECGIFWVDFTLRSVLAKEKKVSFSLPDIDISKKRQDDVIVGVKIYDYKKDFSKLFKEWKSLGINTAFISDILAKNKEFMQMAKKNGIATFIIVPIFCSPDKPLAKPDMYALTGKGKKAAAEWVHFVCPTRDEYRKQRLEYIKDLIKKTKPEGISIDFIRYFVYWEKVFADAKLDPLDNTCFCPNCLRKLQKELNIRIPGELKSVEEKAGWLLENHEKKWVEWKCKIITSMVKDIAVEVKKIDPGILLNAHIVPWRKGDFSNAVKKVTAQDIAAISSYVDYISPMCYSHMVKQNPSWVSSVVRDMGDQVNKKIIPSIQVKESHLKEKLTTGDFKKAVMESLKSPSGGVVFWNWKALEGSPEKKKIVKALKK